MGPLLGGRQTVSLAAKQWVLQVGSLIAKDQALAESYLDVTPVDGTEPPAVRKLYIDVRRGLELVDALAGVNKQGPAGLNGRIDVKFVGEDGIDDGALTREMLAVVGRSLTGSPLPEGPASTTAADLRAEKYRLFYPDAAGKLVPEPCAYAVHGEAAADELYRGMGRLAGLAFTTGNVFDGSFSQCFVEALLGPEGVTEPTPRRGGRGSRGRRRNRTTRREAELERRVVAAVEQDAPDIGLAGAEPEAEAGLFGGEEPDGGGGSGLRSGGDEVRVAISDEEDEEDDETDDDVMDDDENEPAVAHRLLRLTRGLISRLGEENQVELLHQLGAAAEDEDEEDDGEEDEGVGVEEDMPGLAELDELDELDEPQPEPQLPVASVPRRLSSGAVSMGPHGAAAGESTTDGGRLQPGEVAGDAESSDHSAVIGRLMPWLHDSDSVLAGSLKWLLEEVEGEDRAEAMGPRSFDWTVPTAAHCLGREWVVELEPGGADVELIAANRTRYVRRLLEYTQLTSVTKPAAAFRKGMLDVIAEPALISRALCDFSS